MDLVTVDQLLTTTRSVRKRLDLTRPVEPDIIRRCIDIALQAPNGGNRGRYHFIVVTDEAKRASLAELYKKAADEHLVANREAYGPHVFASATYLAEHLHEVPVHIIPCIEGRVEEEPAWMQASQYGSILPAAWSLMLALRARGLGSAWTTLHLMYEAEAATLLGIPESMTQGALLPVAYFTGDDFQPAQRIPGRERTYWDTWGQTR
jgi:nitroreductase